MEICDVEMNWIDYFVVVSSRVRTVTFWSWPAILWTKRS
jgi:hypothetical protein